MDQDYALRLRALYAPPPALSAPEQSLLDAIRTEAAAQVRYLDQDPDGLDWLDAAGQHYFAARLATNQAFQRARFAAYESAQQEAGRG